MDLQSKLRSFSFRGIRPHPTRDLLLVGLGCADWTWPIVEDAVKNWFPNHKMNLSGDDLGMLVGTLVFHHTRNHFAWPTVCKIIEASGELGMSENIVLHFARLYPRGVSAFSTPAGTRKFKQIVREMAKTSLWVETLTFFLDNSTTRNSPNP